VGSDPVEGVAEATVLDVEAVPSGHASVRVDDALRVGGVDLHTGGDLVRPAGDPNTALLGDIRAVGEIDVSLAVLAGVRALREDLLKGGAVIQRQAAVSRRSSSRGS
jgi:hypothetical protein